MVLINYATKEIVAKMVYYGPALCGKTTNLQYIYTKLNPKKRGKMISLATEADRTLFFDFLPMELGMVQGFKVRFQLYTVPGQVFYGATRKLVLKGADAVIFVADSQQDVLTKNLESIEDMKQNLMENSLDPYKIPIVFQYNKRDLGRIMDVAEMEARVNYRQAPYFEAVATEGPGVMETFKEITRLLLQDLKKRHSFMDTDKIRELPPEVFEVKKEPPPEPAPVEYELELGSGIRYEGAEEDVVAGELLDQIEVISLADTVQAEAFFDDVRKGVPMTEARQKASLFAKEPEGPEPDPVYERFERFLEGEWARTDEATITPEELEAVDFLPDTDPEVPPPMPPRQEEQFLGMDMTSAEMMGPDGIVSEPPAARREAVAWAEAPPVVQQVDLSPVMLAIDKLEDRIAALNQEVSRLKEAAPPPQTDFPDIGAQLERMSEALKKASDGQDRLLVSILEAVREGRKGSTDAFEKIEDALKYLIDKARDEGKGAKKKWF